MPKSRTKEPAVIMPNPSEKQIKNRADVSQFLIHLTKNGSHDSYYPGYVSGFLFKKIIVRAEPSLNQIIMNKKIEARTPYGYFKLKISYPGHPRGPVQPDWIKSVCFSEAPLLEIHHFYQAVTAKRNAYQKFGLGFWQEKIRAKGANPISYIDSRKGAYLRALDQMIGSQMQQFIPVMHLFETFGPLVLGGVGYSDFRWEREWRKCGDLNFTFSDVAFGICPASKISQYQKSVNNAFPFIDPDWDEQTIRSHLQQFGANALLAAL